MGVGMGDGRRERPERPPCRDSRAGAAPGRGPGASDRSPGLCQAGGLLDRLWFATCRCGGGGGGKASSKPPASCRDPQALLPVHHPQEALRRCSSYPPAADLRFTPSPLGRFLPPGPICTEHPGPREELAADTGFSLTQ